ncbi:uncharacterized protein LOC131432350 isoform X2 [Malaya genurostris]|uniref:uncharacterized protein LOC131432350 isoform X2 n=1 Tax=Malaya genurostris TaxID=325434 RepID=UPI0026F38817|nr:uncharacterized protein LOC131432350 isoform X2 [Malaya genurostris]
MRHPSRSATSQKLLSAAVFLVVALCGILQPVETRALLLSPRDSLGNTGREAMISRANSRNNNNNNSNSDTVQTVNPVEMGRKSVQQGDILVVIQQQSPTSIESYQREYRDFVQLFIPDKHTGEDGDARGRTVRFQRWKDMVSFEHWLSDPSVSTVLYTAHDGSDSFIGYCDSLSTHLSVLYGKTVLFWPCPRMKKTEKFVPSFETVSFAVKSISQQFNWTEAILFAADANWALPLALAANLHIPYRIVSSGDEDEALKLPERDVSGSVIIVCSSINSPQTISAINQLKTLRRTKILLLDTIGTIFNSDNKLYRSFVRNGTLANGEPNRNLLVLTILTEHFKLVLQRDHGVDLTDYRHISERLLKIRLDDVGSEDDDDDDDYGRASAANRTGVDGWRESNENRTATRQPRHRQALEQLINLTALTSSECDFNYLLSDDNGSQELQALAADHSRCQTLLDSYCDFDVDVDDTNYLNLSSFDNSAENFNRSSTLNMSSYFERATRKDRRNKEIEQFCALLNLDKNQLVLADNQKTKFGDVGASLSSKRLIFSEHFYLYDYILAVVHDQRHTHSHQYRKFQFDFIVFDLKNISNHRTTIVWRPFLILRQDQLDRQKFSMHPVQPGYSDWIIETTIESFWICGWFCWSVIALAVFLIVSIIFASVVFSIAVRNYLLKNRLSKGPNKIVLSPSDFVFPVDMRRVDEGIEAMLCCWLQQIQEFGGPEVDKPDLLKGSIGSLKNLGLPVPPKTSSGSETLVRHNTTSGTAVEFKARYNGDLVQLKEIPLSSGSSQELKTKAMDLLVLAHGLRHENINPLIGWLNEPTRTALVFEHCSRGSLQDVLVMDEIKLDWSFRLSLLTDLVRGMRYLHGSPIRVHGSLSSRNCVVDARWVLKITDYGMSNFYDAQGITPPPKSAKDLLWTAPEALRGTKGYPRFGTQAADVYAFGIIMQEVVVRGEPYCMLSLSPEEIIAKIKKPPPLIRPSVSKGAAPPEAINIMRQCWAENPEMRPDFVMICERFKLLNHGRKVNFVDTMFQMLEKYSNNLEELIRERTEQLDMERKKTEQLLNRMLPSSVADRLKLGLAVEPEEFAEVTIYFSDIVGFTTIAAHCTPVQVVDLLNDLYTCFDATINAYNVYKVETIGDAYMVVGGLPVRTPDHAEQIATMALDLLHQSGNFKVRHLPGVPLQLRIGLHTGPCCAGVVGLTMPRYCLFGDTVNTASRMESTGSSWRIHMSQQTCNLLEQAGGYVIEPRGPIEIKGKGKMHTYWLLGKVGFDRILPTPPPIGYDIAILRKSLFQSEQNNQQQATNNNNNNSNSCNGSTANHSSSHSPSVAGESIDVKVEIIPPMLNDNPMLAPSISVDSNSSNTNNCTLNMTEFQSKTATPSPQARKLSEIVSETAFLSANSSFNRLNPASPGTTSSRLFKRIEELIDLSSPYNYYRCLSPSENNLAQCVDNRFHGYQINRPDCPSKPGSTRFLRRQFSLDKDDVGSSMTASQKPTLDTVSSISVDREQLARMGTLTSIPSISSTTSVTHSSKQQRGIHKQHSASVAQDLEKIEEIPSTNLPQTFLMNHNASSTSTSSLHSDLNDKARTRSAGHNGKELCLSIEALGLR